MKDILITVIPTVIMSVVGYVFGYKKNVADLNLNRLEALEKSITVYNVIIDDMAQKIEHLTGEISKLELRIEELMVENRNLKNNNSL